MFCPRIFYFYNFCDIKLKYPEYVKAGVKFHKNKMNYLKVENFLNLKYHILKFTIIFILKIMNYQNNLKLSAGSKMQLIAYSKLAGEFFNKPFKKIILCHGKNLRFFN